MKIIKSIFTPKKKPISATEVKPNVLRIEKEEFEVPLTDKMSKEFLKRSRDVSLIEPEVKKPVKKTATKPAEIVKSKINAMPAELKTKINAKPVVVKPEIMRATSRSSVKAAEVKTKIIPKTESDISAEVKTEKEQPGVTTRRSSRLNSPVKADSKVMKVTASNFENLRKSKRSVVTKIDRNSLMIESSDEAEADESFDISEISEASEDADELEMIEISENDEEENEEYSDDESEKKKTQKKMKKRHVKVKVNKKKSSNMSKSKKPMMTKKKDASRWERIKKVLESGGTVEALPGRVDEFDWIKRTVTGLLESSLGGCLCKKIVA